MEKHETEMFKGIGKNVPHTYYLVGNETVLDSYGVEVLNTLPNLTALASNTSDFLAEGYFLNVV